MRKLLLPVFKAASILPLTLRPAIAIPLIASASLCFCLSITPTLRAQDYERVAPNIPGPLPTPSTTTPSSRAQQNNVDEGENTPRSSSETPALHKPHDPSRPQPGTEPDQALIPEVKGIIFVKNASEVQASGKTGSSGITIDPSLKILTKNETRLKQKLEPYLGKPLSAKKLKDLEREVIAFYKGHDRPVVNVVTPAQDITYGVIQFVVIESRVGTVKVEGNRFFTTKSVTNGFRLKPGDEISANIVSTDIAWLNRNPFRSVNAVYSPGNLPGQTDITLKTVDRIPFRAYGGYEDSGNLPIGENRYSAGFNWGDAFFLGWDHQLNYQFTFNDDLNVFRSHSGSYFMPLPWRHSLTFFGTYAQLQGQLPAPLNLKGVSDQMSFRYDIPLPRTAVFDWGKFEQDFILGVDYKFTNNNLQFGIESILNTPTEVFQFVYGYNAKLADRFGFTAFSANAFFSPGGMTPDNQTRDFVLSRPFSQANYVYSQFELERDTKLPWSFSNILRFTGQISSTTLPPSEELGLGGHASVRGYEEREFNADEGMLATCEFRTPPYSPGFYVWHKILRDDSTISAKEATTKDQLQFLGFLDYGLGTNFHPQEMPFHERELVSLCSVGPGARYTVGTNLTFRIDWGFQLLGGGIAPRHSTNRGHVGIVVAY